MCPLHGYNGGDWVRFDGPCLSLFWQPREVSQILLSATEWSVRGGTPRQTWRVAWPPPVPLPKQSEQCVWKSTCGATMCEHDTPREGQQTHLRSRMICVTRLPAGIFLFPRDADRHSCQTGTFVVSTCGETLPKVNGQGYALGMYPRGRQQTFLRAKVP